MSKVDSKVVLAALLVSLVASVCAQYVEYADNSRFPYVQTNCPSFKTCETEDHSVQCSGYGRKAPFLLTGSPNMSDPLPPGLKVAFIGDQGVYPPYSSGVLEMLKSENVDIILHAGDIGYGAPVANWTEQLHAVFPGGSVAYIPVLGNHDVDTTSTPRWHGKEGYHVIYDQVSKLGVCEGETGVNFVCALKGMTIVAVSPGLRGCGHAQYVREMFEKYPSQWRVCLFHKNQNLMQIGHKADEVGWELYDACREAGAIVATGHEHSYSRSKTIDDFSNIQNGDYQNNGSTVHVGDGKTFGFVSGVAGRGIRNSNPALVANQWWGSALSDTTSPRLSFGGIICTINDDKAECDFKQISTDHSATPDPQKPITMDSFTIVNTVQAGPVSPFNSSAPTTFRVQVEHGPDDAYYDSEAKPEPELFCSTPSLKFGSVRTLCCCCFRGVGGGGGWDHEFLFFCWGWGGGGWELESMVHVFSFFIFLLVFLFVWGRNNSTKNFT